LGEITKLRRPGPLEGKTPNKKKGFRVYKKGKGGKKRKRIFSWRFEHPRLGRQKQSDQKKNRKEKKQKKSKGKA